MRIFILLIPVFSLLSSCTALTALQKLQAEHATATVWTNRNKIVLFIPMVHIGKPELYADVETMVEDGKRQGFVVFYEGVARGKCNDSMINMLKGKEYINQFYKGSNSPDSICMDTYNRKFRKMIGVSIDSGYANIFHEKGIFRGLVDQSDALVLEDDSTNINVDITRYEMVDAYERRFGEIELSQMDYDVRLSNPTPPASLRLPRNKVNEIIILHRDKYLADHIESSDEKRIMVIYGLAHQKGVFEELKKIDASWEWH